VRIPRLRAQRALGAAERRACLVDLARTGSAHEFLEPLLGLGDGRSCLHQTRLHRACLLAHELRAGGDALAFAHGDRDDALVRFGGELETIAFERTHCQQPLAVVRAGRQRQNGSHQR
jgi:hypothetical protein